MKKIKNFIKTKKIISFIIIIVIALLGYYGYTKYSATKTQTSYVFGKARIGNVTKTISGTGQVSAFSQLDVKSKASGNLVYLNLAANGQKVKKDDLIAKVDTRDAAISLESAKISYAKLVQPADAPTLLQSKNNLSDAIQSNSRSYTDAFSVIVSTYIDLPKIMSGLEDMIYGRTGYLQSENVRSIGQSALDLQTKAGISYDKAKNNYDSLIIQYKNISNTSPSSTIESFVNSTYLLSKEISEVVKNSQSAVDYVESQRKDSAGTTAQANIASWSSTINSDMASLFSAKNTINTSVQNVKQQELNLSKVMTGATELDIASQQLQLRQAENSYEDYFIRAPFDGVLARLSVKPTDIVSNSTTIGTVVSSQKIITITLNEIDVSKVQVGQKTKITFDAISNLIADGTVSTVDLVGTVSQGVVNYNVEISLDTQDERVKSGMSASVSIITESKTNVVIVPNNSIKTLKGMKGESTYYVESFNPPLTVVKGTSPATTGTVSLIPPQKITVSIGLADDSNTEIISGITEGEQIVTKTILWASASATTAVKTTASTRSAGGMFGGRPGN